MFEIGKKNAEKGQETPTHEVSRAEAAVEHSGHPAVATRSASPRGGAAVIGPSITIDGDLRGEEDLIIEGHVSGTVRLTNNSLTIGSRGEVRADVYAKSIQIDGYMEGDVHGSERATIRTSAKVRGNVISPRVTLEDGARFKGSIEMDPKAVDAAFGQQRAASPQGQPSPQPLAGEGGAKVPGSLSSSSTSSAPSSAPSFTQGHNAGNKPNQNGGNKPGQAGNGKRS